MNLISFITLLYFSSNLMATTIAQEELYHEVSFNKEAWSTLEYNNISPNKVTFTNGDLSVDVDKSAGSILHTFKKAEYVNKLTLKATVKGDLNIQKTKQGEKSTDDFLLRIGIIYEGKRKLSYFEKLFAPAWVKLVFSKTPKNVGVSKVVFYNVISDPRVLGLRKKKSGKNSIDSHYILQKDQNGNINANLELPTDKKVVSIWLCFDGDDTNSKYKISINELKLKLKK